MTDEKLILVDLDGCLLLNRNRERYELDIPVLRNFYQAFLRIFYKFFGDENIEYEYNEDLIRFLEEKGFEREYLLTARGFKDFKKNSKWMINDFLERFDKCIFYPGTTLEGEEILESGLKEKITYLFGIGDTEYKINVAEYFSKDHDVFIVDNKIKTILESAKSSFIDNQFLIEDGEIFEVSKSLEGGHQFDKVS